ncbi:MAG: metallophosphoesterase [Woeseiaceae bacterium]
MLALVALAQPVFAAEWHFDNVDRVVAFSDVHGDYDAMVATLQRAELLDEELHWSGGTAHFVLVGDIMDRGPRSRAAMDLLMRMEEESQAAGGKVHVLVGNHEIMNLINDVRYVIAAEYAEFAADEKAEDRDFWFDAYQEHRQMPGGDVEAARADFDKAFPRGFFAHRAAFAPDGKYGSWLFGKPMIVVVNGTAFVHGGLPPTVAETGLEGINVDLLGDVRRYAEQTQVLIGAQLLLPTDRNRDHVEIVERINPATVTDPAVQEAIADVLRLNDPLFSYQSPHWYRGHTYCNPLAEGDRVQAALDKIGAKRVVVGHTPTPNREVISRLGGRVIEVDTGMNSGYYGGSGHALIIENDDIVVVSQDGSPQDQPIPYARRVGSRPTKGMSVEVIEDLLSNGEIIAAADDPERLQIMHNGQAVDVRFVEAEKSGVYPDVAAYRLDRFLRLDMVPVTVKREYRGDEGSLQFVPVEMMTEAVRQQKQVGGGAWCPLPVQWPSMSIFDALTANVARTTDTLLYNLDTWEVVLTGFDQSFTTSTKRPTYLRDGRITVGPSWQSALKLLDDKALQENFADVLDKRRIKALGKRRDYLLSL